MPAAIFQSPETKIDDFTWEQWESISLLLPILSVFVRFLWRADSNGWQIGYEGQGKRRKNFDKIEKNAYFRVFSAFFMQFNLSNKCIRFILLFSKCCQKCCQNCWGNCSRTMCFYATIILLREKIIVIWAESSQSHRTPRYLNRKLSTLCN